MKKPEQKKMNPIHGVRDIPYLTPNFEALMDFKSKALAAEPTGKGNLLVMEGYFGRLFRSSEECVRKELKEYKEKYEKLCQMFDEDPAHEYVEVINWNDLYALHGILPTIAGNLYGYTNTEDYRTDIYWTIEMVTEGEWVKKFGEPFLYYYPNEGSQPESWYLEV